MKLKELEVEGTETTKYFREHPNKLSERIQDIDRIIEDIVFSDIEPSCKEDYLQKLNRTRYNLQSQSSYNPLSLVGIGIVLGIFVKSIFDYSIDGLFRIMGEGFNQGFQQRLKEYIESKNY